jgi:hypothetical protein
MRQVTFTLLMTFAAIVIQLSTRGSVDSDNSPSEQAVLQSYQVTYPRHLLFFFASQGLADLLCGKQF